MKKLRGISYIIALLLVMTGFMLGGCTLLTCLFVFFGHLGSPFWLVLPLLVVLVYIEFIVFVLSMGLIRKREDVKNWGIELIWGLFAVGWRLSMYVPFRIIAALFIGVFKRKPVQSERKPAMIFSIQPIRDQVGEQLSTVS